MSLGSMITKARKISGLSIDQLSDATNIRTSSLREMESNNFAQCGGETYARGHIRNIAFTLNVDPQIFIDAFEAEQIQPTRSIKNLSIENAVMKLPQPARKISWKVLATISVTSLFVIGLAQLFIANSGTSNMPVPTISKSPQSSPSTVATDKTVAQPTATFSTGTGVQVIITATRAKSWLFVSDATGGTLFSGVVSKGSSKTFSTDVSLDFKVGNAGGVDLTVNGQAVDVIGADGEVVSVSYGVDS